MVNPDTQPIAGRSLVMRVVVLSLLWAVLTAGDAGSWIVGAPAVVFGAVASRVLPPLPRWRWSIGGLLRFVVYFLGQSLWTGLDVARRAFDPRRPWAPRMLSYRYRVLEGVSRVFFANTVSLMPGTVSADLHGDELLVHVLDHRQPVDRELEQLEQRVAALFGLGWPGQAPEEPS